MSNPLKGEVELIAGDKSYILRFSIDAICSLEERLARGFPAIAAEMSDPSKVSVKMMRDLLHACLVERQPDMTVKEAGEIIGVVGDIGKVMAKVNDALALAFPTAEASGTKRPTRSPNGRTGLAS